MTTVLGTTFNVNVLRRSLRCGIINKLIKCGDVAYSTIKVRYYMQVKLALIQPYTHL